MAEGKLTRRIDKYVCSRCGDPAGVCWVAQRPLCVGCFTGYAQMTPPTAEWPGRAALEDDRDRP